MNKCISQYKQCYKAYLLIVIVFLGACTTKETEQNITVEAGQVTFRGAATKGPLSGSTISVYAMDSGGNKTGSALAQTTSVDGSWTISVSNPNNELLLVEADGGEYIDESDSETDITKKRRITLQSGEILQGILVPGETTAAINFFTYTLVENLRKEVLLSSDLIQAFNRVRSRAFNSIGFDAFTEIPADPILPANTATEIEKTYALLIGGAAYAINNAAIKTGETQITYDMLNAMVKDLADCQLDGYINGINVSLLLSLPTDLYDDITIENEALRFRNNNYEQYTTTTLPTWDQTEFCNASPTLSQVLPSELVNLTVSSGALSPTFSYGTKSYTLTVPYEVVSISVTPTADTLGSSLSVNTAAVASGQASGNINLTVGSNPIDIIVTAEDGVTQSSYSVIVTRNDPPVFSTSSTISVQENTTSIGNILALDSDGGTVTYSISGGIDQGFFSIDANSGALTFAAARDFESPADDGVDNSYLVEITASDSINSTVLSMVVNVTDANDIAPVITSAATANVAENSTPILTVTQTDVDGGTFTYSMVSGTDVSKFTIDASTGILSFSTAPDFEAPTDGGSDNNYTATVRVSDGVNFTDQNISITVTNLNDNVPYFTTSASPVMVENGTTAATVAAIDDDGDSVLFSITGSGSDNAYFSINGITGVLTFTLPPDYETPGDTNLDNVYEVEITVEEMTDNTRKSTVLHYVAVSDLIELGVADGGINTLGFGWAAFSGADTYKLYVNPDGASGYTQVGSDLAVMTSDVNIAAHLTDWPNALHTVEAYAGATLLSSSHAIGINSLMLDSIGYIKASTIGTSDYFGKSVAISDDGNTMAVGASGEATGGALAGAVFIFTRAGNTWVEHSKITASNPDAGDWFGNSVALNGDGTTLAVGATGESTTGGGIDPTADNSTTNAGAVYVYTLVSNAYTQQSFIKASNPGNGDNFGDKVALSNDGNTLAVGALNESSSTMGISSTANDLAASSGAVYVFLRTGSVWSEQAYIKASNTGPADNFGFNISLNGDGNTLAVGAIKEQTSLTGIGVTPNDAGTDVGAVYVFTRASSVWTQEEFIKPSSSDNSDNFGYSVSLSDDGNTLAVGAYLEDSDTTGINTTTNNNAADSGAVFVYTRSGVAWAEESYIKASNTGASDNFGFSVALSNDGNTLAVGASGEASDTLGVNSTANETGGTDTGAAYVYLRDTGTWTQKSYLKATNTGTGDKFGHWIAISGDGQTLAVSAPWEDSSTTGIDPASPDESMSSAGAVYLY